MARALPLLLALAAAAGAPLALPAQALVTEPPVLASCEADFILVGYCVFLCLPGNLVTVEGAAGGLFGIAQVRVQGKCGGADVVCSDFVVGFTAECARTGGPAGLPGVGTCEGGGWLSGTFRCRAHAPP
jgi:hypothetical protein